jgi:hypothetical protein
MHLSLNTIIGIISQIEGRKGLTYWHSKTLVDVLNNMKGIKRTFDC